MDAKYSVYIPSHFSVMTSGFLFFFVFNDNINTFLLMTLCCQLLHIMLIGLRVPDESVLHANGYNAFNAPNANICTLLLSIQ